MFTSKPKVSRVQRFVDVHSSMADFVSEHEELLRTFIENDHSDKLPHIGLYAYGSELNITVYGPDKRDTMRILRRAIGGKWDKGGYGSTFQLSRYAGWNDCLTVTISSDRGEVCKRVVVGTETKTIPAVEAQPERTEVVEKVEWVCGDLLTD